MKIVQIEDFFHPDAGYQINILSKYFANDGNEVSIIAAELEQLPRELSSFFGSDNISKKDEEYSKANNVSIHRLPVKKIVFNRVVFDWKKLTEVINSEKPDVLYLHGNDTFISIWCFLHYSKFKCAFITDSHMVEMASTSKGKHIFRLLYRLFITPIIRKKGILVIRTADDDYIEKAFNIPVVKSPLVALGTDIFLFHPNQERYISFREENAISKDAFVILYAGKLDESKGGMLLGQLTQEKIMSDREIVFVIIGNTVGEYGGKVENLFKKSKYKIMRFPTQKYSNLASYYQCADLALIPKQCSLSIYDYEACGVPVVCEDNEINRNRINTLEGLTFDVGNVTSMVKQIEHFANMDRKEANRVSQSAAIKAKEQYGYDLQYKIYKKAIEECITNQCFYAQKGRD